MIERFSQWLRNITKWPSCERKPMLESDQLSMRISLKHWDILVEVPTCDKIFRKRKFSHGMHAKPSCETNPCQLNDVPCEGGSVRMRSDLRARPSVCKIRVQTTKCRYIPARELIIILWPPRVILNKRSWRPILGTNCRNIAGDQVFGTCSFQLDGFRSQENQTCGPISHRGEGLQSDLDQGIGNCFWGALGVLRGRGLFLKNGSGQCGKNWEENCPRGLNL